jgi:hypothetical protein
MLYIIALLLFLILLAIVWGKTGVKLGMYSILFVISLVPLSVFLWIYQDAIFTIDNFYKMCAMAMVSFIVLIWDRISK